MITKEKIKLLANQIMFDLDENQLHQLEEDFQILLKQIETLDRIDTTDVEEMIYPFEEETTYLRDDVINHTLTREEALKNVSATLAGHVHVPKVVK